MPKRPKRRKPIERSIDQVRTQIASELDPLIRAELIIRLQHFRHAKRVAVLRRY